MMGPWIGIPTRYNTQLKQFGQSRHYLDAIIWAGGVPVMIPPLGERAVIEKYFERLDGVLLPGSPTDIDPSRYGKTPHEKLGPLNPQRDETDFSLLELAESRQRPVLAICFGLQSLNVYRGGSLIQDIPSLVPQAVRHDQEGDPLKAKSHEVRLAEGSLLERLVKNRTVQVNSYHHQAVETAGRDLRAVAFAPDGVIEALEDTKGRFIVGVQWHPERGWENDEVSRALFSAFLEEAQKASG